MEIPSNLPSSIWVTAWAELYKCFGERLQQDELDLMDSVLRGVVADAQEEIKMREEDMIPTEMTFHFVDGKQLSDTEYARYQYSTGLEKGRQMERERIIKYLDEANDTRDLDKRLQTLKGEANA